LDHITSNQPDRLVGQLSGECWWCILSSRKRKFAFLGGSPMYSFYK
jgi:hypothetical protein